MKNFESVGFTVFLIAGGLAVAGDYFSLPLLTYAAFVVIGLLVCISGTRVVFRGEAFEGRSNVSDPRYVRRFTGVSAYLIGAVILMAGFLLIGLAVAGMFTPGGVEEFLTSLVGFDFGIGIVLLLAGMIVIAFGVVRMLSGSGASPGAYTRLAEFSIKASGVVSILLGAGMVLIALGFLLAPEVLRDLFAQVVEFGKSLLLGQ